MKLDRIKWAALALAMTAAVTIPAKSFAVVAPVGSLLLGFEQDGAGNNLIVNIGSWQNYISTGQLGFTGPNGDFVQPGVAVTVPGLSLQDLSGNFADWNNNSQANLLQWGVVGYNSGTATGTTDGVANRTIFYTIGREDPLVQSDAPDRRGSAAQNTIIGNINTVRSNFALNVSPTPNSSVSGLVSSGSGNSFTFGNDNYGGGFGWGVSVEQSLFGSNRGPTNSVLDLYASAPGSGDPLFLGTFALSNSGELTFTAAVPEPSTYALIGIGLGSLVFLRRFKKQKV